MDLDADFAFARASGEFTHIAPMLRYVAAINPDVTQLAFVQAAADLGYNKNTAAIQFKQSRRFSVTFGDCVLLPDGRLQEIQT